MTPLSSHSALRGGQTPYPSFQRQLGKGRWVQALPQDPMALCSPRVRWGSSHGPPSASSNGGPTPALSAQEVTFDEF